MDASLVRSSESDRSRQAKGKHETVCRKVRKSRSCCATLSKGASRKAPLQGP